MKQITKGGKILHRKGEIMKLTTRNLALAAIFGALYYVLSLIAPIRIPTAVGELSIGFTALIASIIGIVLGPYLGASTAFLGALITWSVGTMGPFDFAVLLSPTLNALVTGLIFYKKWKIGFTLFGVLIIAFLFTPPVHPLTEHWFVALAVLFDKIIALFLILPLVKFSKQLSIGKASLFYFLLFFIGNQVDNMWGSFIFATPLVYEGIFGMSIVFVRGAFLSLVLFPILLIRQQYRGYKSFASETFISSP